MNVKTYKVTVEEIEVDGVGDAIGISTLFTAEHRSAARLGMFAPQEVAAALGEAAMEPEQVQPAEQFLQETAPVGVFRDAQPVKRKRRTKAEIAADEAAAGRASLEAEVAARERDQAEQRNDVAAVIDALPELAAEEAPTAPAESAAPYNPFAPK